MPAPMLLAQLLAGSINENSAHRFRGGCKEVPSTVEVLSLDKAKVRFMDQCGRVEGVPRMLRRHFRCSDFLQFVIDERKQFIRRSAVAVLSGFEEAGQVRHEANVYAARSPSTIGPTDDRDLRRRTISG